MRFQTRALAAEGQLRRLQNESVHAAEVALLRERGLQGQVLYIRNTFVQTYSHNACITQLSYQVAAMEDTIAKLASELRQAAAPRQRGWHY